jgi:hypothetical protein
MHHKNFVVVYQCLTILDNFTLCMLCHALEFFVMAPVWAVHVVNGKPVH